MNSFPKTFFAADTSRPVLSASTWASFTAPSSMTKAYRLERSPPKMAAPSKERSNALVKRRSGSARKRIWLRSVYPICLLERRWRTPLEPDGSRVLPHAFMLEDVRLKLSQESPWKTYTKASLTDTEC